MRITSRWKGEDGTELINQVMPGTHVTLDLLNFSIFQRYQLATPAYRESKELFSELKWKPCRQNLLNWESKAADWQRRLIPALKDSALAEGAELNVDETWHRYQTHFGQEKIYIWCVVNRKANIVIYYFEQPRFRGCYLGIRLDWTLTIRRASQIFRMEPET